MIAKATKPATPNAATMGMARMAGVPINPPSRSDKNVVGSTVAAASKSVVNKPPRMDSLTISVEELSGANEIVVVEYVVRG